MKRAVATRIDEAACIGCGLCVRVCPADALAMVEGKAKVVGETSMGCGHCQAVCPARAIIVDCLEPESPAFETFETDRRWLAPGAADPAALARLMASRRSCRNYLDRPVPPKVLRDLIRFGVTAPSGTNSQCWTFTVIPDRGSVLAWAEAIGGFFRRLNQTSEKAWLRNILAALGKTELRDYYRDHYESVKLALDEWETKGRERLFHGATAAIVIGSRPGASCPAEDALLATQNILLGAHALGLGSCLIGFAVAAAARDAGLRAMLGLPAGEMIHAVAALGYPDETYQVQAGRMQPVVRFWRG